VFRYYATLADGRDLQGNITIDSKTGTINVNCTSIPGNSSLILIGELQNSQRKTVQINITVNATPGWQLNPCPIVTYPFFNTSQISNFLLNMGPPIFIDDSVFKQKLMIPVNESYDFLLPSIYDPDGDSFNVDVDLGMAVIFANYSTFKQRSILMNP
jgi:hypothetical protein